MSFDVNSTTLEGLTSLIINKVFKDIQVCLPAVITNVVDRTTVDVQPCIQFIDYNDNPYDRSIISSVKIASTGTSKYIINMPISNGDFGLLIACDRDISLFLQKPSNSPPATSRKHSFSDSFFIPLCIQDIKVQSENADDLVISNVEGDQCFSIGPSGLKAKFPSINLNGVIIDQGGNVTANDVKIGSISTKTHIHAGGIIHTGPMENP